MVTVNHMDVSQQIAAVWQAQAAKIGMVWWLLPRFGQGEADPAASSKLQARITTGLLLTPFDAATGREVGAQLAHHFRFHLEKFGRLQRLLAEQLLAGLDGRQTAWLASWLGVETRTTAAAGAWQTWGGWLGNAKPDTLEGDGPAADFS